MEMAALGHLRRCNPASKSFNGRCCPKADRMVRRGERSFVPFTSFAATQKSSGLFAVSSDLP